MLFYSWPKIRKHSNGRVSVIRTIFESMLGYPTAAVGRRRYDEMDFDGDSYLLKPEKLMWAFHNANQKDAANYLMLASKRNYAEYLMTGDFTLPIKHINIPIETLETNSLIDIEGTDIHFKLEN